MGYPGTTGTRIPCRGKPSGKRAILGVSGIPILVLLGASIAVAVFTSRVLEEARNVGGEITSLGPLVISLLLFLISGATVVVLQAVRFGHRIKGPVFRFLVSLERIKGGDLGFRLRLREGDELKDLAEGMNEFLDWLEKHPPGKAALTENRGEGSDPSELDWVRRP